jgi:hypothetical protein
LSSFAISHSFSPFSEEVVVSPLLVVVPVGVVFLSLAFASFFANAPPIGHHRSPPGTATTTYRQLRPSGNFSCSRTLWSLSSQLVSNAGRVLGYKLGGPRSLGFSLSGDQGSSCGAQPLLLNGLLTATRPRIPARAVDHRGALLDWLDSPDPQQMQRLQAVGVHRAGLVRFPAQMHREDIVE